MYPQDTCRRANMRLQDTCDMYPPDTSPLVGEFNFHNRRFAPPVVDRDQSLVPQLVQRMLLAFAADAPLLQSDIRKSDKAWRSSRNGDTRG